MNHSPRIKTILILAAIPHGLRLDKEIRSIEEAIRRAAKRDVFEIKIRTAVRPTDIRRALAEEKPSIVHFCGHGLELQNFIFRLYFLPGLLSWGAEGVLDFQLFARRLFENYAGVCQPLKPRHCVNESLHYVHVQETNWLPANI